MFRIFFILGVVAGISAAAGVTAASWFLMSNWANPLTVKWGGMLFGGVAGTILLATLLLYLATRLTLGIWRFFTKKETVARAD